MIKYKKGDIVEAKITSVYSYGAFAKIDDEYSGLIHISEITKDFVRNVKDFVDVGDNVNVKIIDVTDNKNQLKLSIKDVPNDLFKNKGIKETVFGFYLLKKALPKWISKKMNEIDKNL